VPTPTPVPVPMPASDGTRVAFYSDRDGNLEIYVMDTDGSGQTRLTGNPAEDLFPSDRVENIDVIVSK